MTPCKAVANAYVCHNHGRCYWMRGSVDVRDVLHVHTKCKWREHLPSEGRSDAERDEEVILVCSQRVSRCYTLLKMLQCDGQTWARLNQVHERWYHSENVEMHRLSQWQSCCFAIDYLLLKENCTSVIPNAWACATLRLTFEVWSRRLLSTWFDFAQRSILCKNF